MLTKGFTANQLKLLACLFMLIDHCGYLLWPEAAMLRIVGRLAFPLFAFMIANGYRHTRSRKQYLLRLALFALLYQPVYSFCMQTDTLNIFATLALGLSAILADESLRGRGWTWAGWLTATVIGVLAQVINADYGFYGVALIFTAERFFAQKEKLAISWLAINALPIIPFYPLSVLQVFSLLALPLIHTYNGERGGGSRWFFYAFYCLHIPALYAIRLLMFGD